MLRMKFIGSIFLIMGSAIGAGILALPLVTSLGSSAISLLVMLAIAILMLYTGLMTLEVNMAMHKDSNSFSTMAERFLKIPGKIICWICFIMVLYMALAAYIEGMGSLTAALLGRIGFEIPSLFCSLFITAFFGTVVALGTYFVDSLNKLLFSFKGLFILLSLVFMVPDVRASLILSYNTTSTFWAQSLPIFVTCFSYQFIIPSIVNYLGKENHTYIRNAIIIGSFLPFFIYGSWFLMIQGIVPQTGPDSFEAINQSNEPLAMMLGFLGEKTSSWATLMLNGFSNITMTTSFLGIALSLFDFLRDGFHLKKNLTGKITTFILTFAPPVLFVILVPKGFVLALQYSGIFTCFLIIMLPALMLLKKRQERIETAYEVPTNTVILYSVAAIGVLLAFAQFY
jgi:tyrosine-specific transport protein